MNEAETRAEHIDPALKAAGWGVVEGSRILREYPITLGRHRRTRATWQGPDRRLRAGLSQHKLAVIEAKAWDEALTEGVAQAKNYAGKLAVRYHLFHQRSGHLRHRHEGGQGRRIVDQYPTPDELWNLTFAEAERLARPLRRRAVRGQGRLLPGTLLSGHRH